MTERIEKKKQLDDEMSRFEAEILGPSPLQPPPAPPGLKTIIGTNTFNKVTQQLNQTNDVPTLLPPPCPPTFRLPPMDGPPRCFRPPENGPRPFPPNFGPSTMGPIGPRPGPFMGQFNRPVGPGPNFMGNGHGPQTRFNPPPPPGFIPPQVHRPPGGPMMPVGQMPPRPGFINPPPPPRGLLMADNKMEASFPPVISRAPTIISSAPKLYTAVLSTEKITENEVPVVSAECLLLPFESKKKKAKVENKQPDSTSVAIEMADKVKHSTVTTKFTPKTSTSSDDKKKDKKSKKNLRYAGGQVWEDTTLGEWEHGDFRLFAGDLGNDVTDELLNRYFSHYPSFLKAKVVRDKRTNKSKGYGFISFRDSHDYIKAMKEINGKYVGSRPIKLRKSMWKERSFDVVQKKIKEKQIIGLK